MDTLIRVEYMRHLQGVSTLVDAYSQRTGDFAASTATWLKAVEETLNQLRQPGASLVSAERARLASVADGNQEPGIAEKTPRRKMERLVARSALSNIEELLRGRVMGIDERFADLRDKLAQAVSIAHASEPLPMPATNPREAWLQRVWKHCGAVPSVAALFRFLEAALRPMDRLNLLDDVVRNLTDEFEAPAQDAPRRADLPRERMGPRKVGRGTIL